MIKLALLFILTIISGLIYLFFLYNNQYWKRKKLAYIHPTLFFGNLKEMVLFKKNPGEVFEEMYKHEETRDLPVVGIYIFNKPALLIRDIELIKKILVKDFNDFSDRFVTCDPHSDALGGYNLFFMKNPLWKTMRTNITPVFTTGKLKQMFPLLCEIGEKLDHYLCDKKPEKGNASYCLELKDLCARYSTDAIASVAFGLNADSINKLDDDDFRRNGQGLFKVSIRRAIDFIALFFLPKVARFCKVKFFTPEASHFLRSTIAFVMKNRVKSGVKRNDLIDTLVTLKKNGINIDGKNIVENNDVLVAQAAVFFTAGFETSSSLMSFALYELGRQPDIQNKLRAEIKDVLQRSNGNVTYDDIFSMEYMHAITQETLRMYPPLPFLDRQCTEKSGYSLEPYADFVLPKGMPVFIPVYAIQRDPKYFESPEVFSPERFLGENKSKIAPYTNIPFGTGPHNCIGERLGYLQSKVGLFHFLKNHYVRPSKTNKPMQLSKVALVLAAEDGVYCNVYHDPLYLP